MTCYTHTISLLAAAAFSLCCHTLEDVCACVLTAFNICCTATAHSDFSRTRYSSKVKHIVSHMNVLDAWRLGCGSTHCVNKEGWHYHHDNATEWEPAGSARLGL
jgi:hypothetical protein